MITQAFRNEKKHYKYSPLVFKINIAVFLDPHYKLGPTTLYKTKTGAFNIGPTSLHKTPHSPIYSLGKQKYVQGDTLT